MVEVSKVRNREKLLSHGDLKAREQVIFLMDKVLYEVDAGKRIHELVSLKGDTLCIGESRWNLGEKRNIYLIGAGKACNAMAQAVCEILGDRITKGVISVKIKEPQDRYINTDVYVGGHPLPNAQGMEAAFKILSLIESSDKDDLFISVISGGSSALLTCPVENITLEDEILGQDILLKSGAKIIEINAVRRHISQTNGGKIAQRIVEAGAELINLVVSDSVNFTPPVDRRKPYSYFGTPVAPDKTTIQDARDMIMNYALYDRLPGSITRYLWDDKRVKETPKSFESNVTTFLLGAVSDSCDAAVRIAEEMNIPLMVLTTFLEGESREAGKILSSLAREIRYRGNPIAPPCFVVCAGETTTNIDAKPEGTGGPSHELVLGLAIGIRGIEGIAGASIDTEGTDGTTLFAGGLVDGSTIDRLHGCGVDIYQALRNHSTGNALGKINDNIFTGNTGTNLCDFNILYVSE